ncbi:uncharacterized protein [Anabrus simplex]|uniref:uncharacterized protein n=1 Tax=Anabrus simplex TaxID=316456 RepID=UPI0035A2AEC9
MRAETFPGTDHSFVKKKIQNLRSSFRKETKKMKSCERRGAGADDIYEPTLWYHGLLLFTKDQDFYREPPSVPKKKLKTSKRLEVDMASFIQSCSAVLNEKPKESDDCDALGKYVSQKLRKMNGTRQIYAEALIQKIITKGLLEKLNENTDIVDLRPQPSFHSTPNNSQQATDTFIPEQSMMSPNSSTLQVMNLIPY